MTAHTPSVGIAYGFNEGPALSTRLYAALAARGFSITTDLSAADILIAHSGGLFLLPKDTAGKTIFIMNPSCAPLRKFPVTFVQKMWTECRQNVKDGHTGEWRRKAARNVWCALTRPVHNWQVATRNLKHAAHLPDITAKKVLVVTARHDPWAARLPLAETARLPRYTFLSHAGTHDSLWLTPGHYADIVQSVYGA